MPAEILRHYVLSEYPHLIHRFQNNYHAVSLIIRQTRNIEVGISSPYSQSMFPNLNVTMGPQ
jgi:hypothetical protein